jgi:hypothetical protein
MGVAVSNEAQDALRRAHSQWQDSRFAGTDKSHEEHVLDTLAGFLDSPVIEAKPQPWRAEA